MPPARGRLERGAYREPDGSHQRISHARGRRRRGGARLGRTRTTDYRSGRDAALALLAEEPFDGVFCVTDLLALGFLDAARPNAAAACLTISR